MDLSKVDLQTAADALKKYAAAKQADIGMSALGDVGMGGLIGAGLGAGAGAIYEGFQPGKKKNYLQRAITGAALGGTLGAGAGAVKNLVTDWNTPKPDTDSSLIKKLEDAHAVGDIAAYNAHRKALEDRGLSVNSDSLLGSIANSATTHSVNKDLMAGAVAFAPTAARHYQAEAVNGKEIMNHAVRRDANGNVIHNEFADRLRTMADETAPVPDISAVNAAKTAPVITKDVIDNRPAPTADPLSVVEKTDPNFARREAELHKNMLNAMNNAKNLNNDSDALKKIRGEAADNMKQVRLEAAAAKHDVSQMASKDKLFQQLNDVHDSQAQLKHKENIQKAELKYQEDVAAREAMKRDAELKGRKFETATMRDGKIWDPTGKRLNVTMRPRAQGGNVEHAKHMDDIRRSAIGAKKDVAKATTKAELTTGKGLGSVGLRALLGYLAGAGAEGLYSHLTMPSTEK